MLTPDQLKAAERLLLLKKAPTSFLDYIKFRHPDWVIPDFHLELIQVLDDLIEDRLINANGDVIDNLIITMPPRHSKSTISTVELPSYYMGHDPSRFVMGTSYNAELATDFGREVRDIINSKDYSQVFKEAFLSKDSKAAATWRTGSGGAYFGMGLGGSTSGRPANLLIVDDPYKNRIDAESATVRKNVWSYYQSALTTRLQPTNDGRNPKQIIIHTRWHPDDLIGRIMETEDFKDGDWYHVDYKAITTDEDGTEHALWPARFPLKRLKRMQRANPREFEALYQQAPFIAGGNILKSSWWQYYPDSLKPDHFATLIIPMDTAFKKNQGNDWSVAMPMGMTSDGDIFILNMIRDRYEFPALIQKCVQINNLYRGKGLRAWYIEDKASGISLVQTLKRRSGMSVIPYSNPDDKTARAHAIAPIVQGGRVFLPENAPWIDQFMTEAEQFPDGSFDDIIDTLMIGIDVLSRTTITADNTMEEGTSLLQDYNDQRDLIRGTSHPMTKRSLNQLSKSKHQWKGWGL